MKTPLQAALEKTAGYLALHRAALVEAWVRELRETFPRPAPDLARICGPWVDRLLDSFRAGTVEEMLQAEAAPGDLPSPALALRILDRCCLPFLSMACPDRESLAEAVLALEEVGVRRTELILQREEQESARRLVEAEEAAARAAERVRDLARANEGLRRSQAVSQHRAEQIALLSSVVHHLARITDPDRLLEVAAQTIQARMNHTFVAVVVLDDEGMLVGRWAGRPGVGRRSAGRTQGPAGGVIGRALRKRAPQVVGEVAQDPDYHPDVPGTRSEMVIPLLDMGEAVGVIDFQSDQPQHFDLDAVAVGETLAEFLVVALANARMFDELRRARRGQPDSR